ncbi:ATP-binding cassette domain-containing protein, partial [Roseibium denhamense]|nr:ATP-binding cassette domain-containing protein [Roseibium denhamense]
MLGGRPMMAVWDLIKLQYRYNRQAFALGLVVALIPVMAGFLLLGVAGWFITAAAFAGLTGVFLNIFVPSAMIRALAILRTGGRYGERLLTHNATFLFLADLRNRIFAGISDARTGGKRSGLLLNQLTKDISALDTVYLRLVVPFFLLLVIGTVLLCSWAQVSAAMMMLGAGFFAIVAAGILTIVKTADNRAPRLADAAANALRLRAADLAAGRKDLAIYGGLDQAANHVLTADDRYAMAEEGDEKRAIRIAGASQFLGQLLLAATVVLAVMGVSSGQLGLPVAVALVLVSMALPELLSMVIPGLVGLPRSKLAADRTMSVMRPGDIEAPVATPQRQTGAADRPQQHENAVLSFQSVCFRYPRAERLIVDNLTFQIGRGEVLAVAGRSGCGKSTLAALAARLIDPERGEIKLNGAAIRALPEVDLRRKITVLGQRPHLFNDTVGANLRIANPGASDTDLWIALAQAAVASRISDSPNGLNTVLGEGGFGLSGG